jgi:hypothetical protein
MTIKRISKEVCSTSWLDTLMGWMVSGALNGFPEGCEEPHSRLLGHIGTFHVAALRLCNREDTSCAAQILLQMQTLL